LSRYTRGRDFEYQVRDDFKDHAALVVRSAGSKGVADLVVLRANRKRYADVALIQCKAGRTISNKESKALAEVAKDAAATAVVALKENGNAMYYPLHGTGRPVYSYGLTFDMLLTFLCWWN
jgi:Holliday junction resolvase